MSGIGRSHGSRHTRRRVLGVAGVAGLSGALQAAGVLRAAAAGPAVPAADPTAVRATMRAYADTIVPGPAGGADPEAGAVEAGVVAEIYRPFYGVAAAFPVLHADIQVATPRVLGRPAGFDLQLPYADRERVVADRITEVPAGGDNPLALAYQAAALLVHLVYYGVASSEVGPRVMGFPPASDGYPDHSYRVGFEGMTAEGNPA